MKPATHISDLSVKTYTLAAIVGALAVGVWSAAMTLASLQNGIGKIDGALRKAIEEGMTRAEFREWCYRTQVANPQWNCIDQLPSPYELPHRSTGKPFIAPLPEPVGDLGPWPTEYPGREIGEDKRSRANPDSRGPRAEPN